MAHNWFQHTGWFYRPNSIVGVAACAVALAFCVNVFIAIDRHSHSSSDTLYGVFPYLASSFLLLDWLARNTSSDAGARR